jgi:hypothetical protein
MPFKKYSFESDITISNINFKQWMIFTQLVRQTVALLGPGGGKNLPANLTVFMMCT